MILATTIFMTAKIALDRVPDAFAFFCQTSSLAEALEKSLSSRVAVETRSFSHWVWRFQKRQQLLELLVHQVELVSWEPCVQSSSFCPQSLKSCLRIMLLNNSCAVGWVQTASVNLWNRYVHILALLIWFESFVALFQHFVRLQVLSFPSHFSHLNNLWQIFLLYIS